MYHKNELVIPYRIFIRCARIKSWQSNRQRFTIATFKKLCVFPPKIPQQFGLTNKDFRLALFTVLLWLTVIVAVNPFSHALLLQYVFFFPFTVSRDETIFHRIVLNLISVTYNFFVRCSSDLQGYLRIAVLSTSIIIDSVHIIAQWLNSVGLLLVSY